MKEDSKVEDLCKQIIELTGEGAHFNFKFDHTIIIGSVMNFGKYGISAGSKNNMIADPGKFANLFYTLVLMYICQIRDVMNYTTEQVIAETIRMLAKDGSKIDLIPSVMSFRTNILSGAGNA